MRWDGNYHRLFTEAHQLLYTSIPLSSRDVHLKPEQIKHITQPLGYFTSQNLVLWMSRHTHATLYYSYTIHCLQSHWTLTGRSVQRCFPPAVFFFSPFPCPPELPEQQWAGPVWTTELILQAGVRHFPFYLSLLFPSVCSLSTLLSCLHPAVCELQ